MNDKAVCENERDADLARQLRAAASGVATSPGVLRRAAYRLEVLSEAFERARPYLVELDLAELRAIKDRMSRNMEEFVKLTQADREKK